MSKVYLAIIEISYEGVTHAHVFKTLEAAKRFKGGVDDRRYGYLAVYEVEPSDSADAGSIESMTLVYQD